MITKVKYRGNWRNVLGITKDNKGNNYYKLQCLNDKSMCFKVRCDNPEITAIVESENQPNKLRKKRYNNLTDMEMFGIYTEYKSGYYYIKEIMEKYNITKYTIDKVVSNYEL